MVYPEEVTFPGGERTTYTAAAMVLAADALSGATAAAGLFRGEGLPVGLDLAEPHCIGDGRARLHRDALEPATVVAEAPVRRGGLTGPAVAWRRRGVNGAVSVADHRAGRSGRSPGVVH